MADNNIIKLQLKDREEIEANKKAETKVQIPFSTQSNPIYKNMLKFHHAKIGEKLSIKDLLR